MRLNERSFKKLTPGELEAIYVDECIDNVLFRIKRTILFFVFFTKDIKLMETITC